MDPGHRQGWAKPSSGPWFWFQLLRQVLSFQQHTTDKASVRVMESRIALLREQIATTEAQLAQLKAQLSHAESQAESARQLEAAYQGGFPAEWMGEALSALTNDSNGSLDAMSSPEELARSIRQDTVFANDESFRPDTTHANPSRWPLSGDEYRRYGRQMIMNEVGLHGQLRLKHAKVLLVGCGGLGCPAAAYLAGAGVGTIGLMDGDTVEVSNLHRQIVHSTAKVDMSKVDSAIDYCRQLNPLLNYVRHPFHLTPSCALDTFSQYDLVLDCTDHPTSRYLISDTCVLAGKPLVSASALKTEGQLIVLNNPPRSAGDSCGGPCYRCIFPKPPPADSVLSCGEGGILGPVVGVMGVLQALEAIKLLTRKPTPSNGFSDQSSPRATMLIFSAFTTPQFRTVRMRSRRSDCAACSSTATITPSQLLDGSLDYAAFCGLTHPVNILSPTSRVTASEFARLPRDGSNTLIDVRDETQYAMCALRGSINVPWQGSGQKWLQHARDKGALSPHMDNADMYVVCRYGNDSQLAVQAMLDLVGDDAKEAGSQPEGLPGTRVRIRDIRGGFRAWRDEVDSEWPDY